MGFYLYLLCRRFEALVASQLEPEAFGTYMANGTLRQTTGEVLFIEVDPEKVTDVFDIDNARRECVPHPDGKPHRSRYVSIYRVLERIPAAAFGRLHMTTRDGRTLAVEQTAPDARWEEPGVNMYHELCPTSPLVVSSLGPVSFLKEITDPENPVNVPKMFMADMLIDQNPDGTLASYLPYRHPSHIHECINQVTHGSKNMKTVDRHPMMTGFFRMIRRGFFLGNQHDALYYPFPSKVQLEEEHHLWWRSASLS